MTTPAPMPECPKQTRRVPSPAWAVAGLMLLAAGIRFAFLGSIPDLNADEACAGVYAQHLLGGDWRYLAGVTDYFGPLHTALVALAMRIGGANALAIRSVSALAGVALVPAVYWLARQLHGRPAAGIAAALLAAVFPLHVALSRLGYSVSLLPAVDGFALACLLRCYRGGGMRWAVFAGLLLGAGLQLHPAQYPLVAALAAEFVWRRRWRALGGPQSLALLGLAGAQSPAILDPLLAIALGSSPELRFAIPAPAAPEGWTPMASARVFVGVAAGLECADLGAHQAYPATWVLSVCLAVLLLAAGGAALRGWHRETALLGALVAAAMLAPMAVGSAMGEGAWRQRYLALLSLLLPVVMAGTVCCRRSRAPAWVSWFLVVALAGLHVQRVCGILLARRAAPRPIAALARDLPGVLARRPWGILAENWWIFWPARFLTADQVPILCAERNLTNEAPPAPGATSEMVWIGWGPDGRRSGWHPMAATTPKWLCIRSGTARQGKGDR